MIRVLVEAVFTTDAVRKGDGGWVDLTPPVQALINRGALAVVDTDAPDDDPDPVDPGAV